jgi:methanogenic corrinoid protein MtbC1
MAILNRDHMTLANVFVDKALSPDETDLYSFLSYLYEHHLELWEIYDLVIAPGLSEIGERWARGEVGISKEHRASYETLDALSKLQAEIHRRPGENSSVVCACVDEESHEIGLRCVANIFESEGWRVYYLGGRTPYESIITTVKEVRPTAVCLTSLVPSSVDMLKKHLKEIYSQAKPSGATVILRAGVLGANNGEGIFLDLTLRSAKEVYDYIHQTRSATVKKIESADAMKRPRGHAS